MRKENVPFSARAAAARRAGNRMSAGFGSTSALSEDGAEDDARAEHAQLVAELKEQLQRAEFASEQYQKQLEVLQLRLDEVLIDQTRLEEQGHQRDAEIQILQANAKDFARQRKEMEQFHEAEKALILKERDQQARKEEELQVVIRRLNDTIRQRDIRFQDASPSGRSSPRLDGETFAPLPPTSQEEPNERWTLLPLAPLLPQWLVRRWVGVSASSATSVVSSNLGVVNPAAYRPDGREADHFAMKSLAPGVTKAIMHRLGGLLVLLSGRIHGRVFVSVLAYQPGRSNSNDYLRQRLSSVLSDFSLTATTGWPCDEPVSEFVRAV